MTTALVVGASGLVGRHLAARLAHTHRVVAPTHAELDVTDAAGLRRTVARERPALVVSCAVLQVDECEADPARAAAVNVAGPRVLAEAAADAGATVVHFSSNYVFDGEPVGRPPYTVDDTPAPLNVYGRTKWDGERAVVAACPRAVVIRTSWVFGPGKESFVGSAARALRAGRRLHAVADVWASTTWVEDLVERTLAILALDHPATYHVVNAGVCSHLEFAGEAARAIDLAPARAAELIESVREADRPRVARRPRYTPMRCTVSEALGLGPLRDWRVALADYVQRER